MLDVVALIANGPPDLQANLEKTLKGITKDKDRLRSLMKENFLLHHDVISLDEQIKMLIKNRITVEEVRKRVYRCSSPGADTSVRTFHHHF